MQDYERGGIGPHMKMKDYPDVMNVAQLAEVLNIGRNSAYALLASGEIAHRKIGRKYLIPKRCVLDYLSGAGYNGQVMAGNPNCPEKEET